MFLKSTRIVLINIQPSVTSYKYMVSLESDPDSVFNCLSVCVFLCSDDNDTKCSKLLKASLRGTSGIALVQLCIVILAKHAGLNQCRLHCNCFNDFYVTYSFSLVMGQYTFARFAIYGSADDVLTST